MGRLSPARGIAVVPAVVDSSPVKRLWLPVALVALCAPLAACGSQREAEVSGPEIGQAAPATSPTGRVTGGPGAGGVPKAPALDRGAGAGVGGGAQCTGTELEPSAENLAAVKSATVCLLNVERRARGLGPLRTNVALSRASLGHAKDMVAHHYFAHVSPSGEDMIVRVRRTGYLAGSKRWVIGENLAYGTGAKATPAEMVQAWMASPPHRSNILYGGFKETGLGIALGSPTPGEEAGATYTSGFGAR